MNLLTTYLVAKGLKEATKDAGRGGSYGGIDSGIVKPSKEQIQEVLQKYGDNVALANYVKNIHTSTWDHCEKRRRQIGDNKTLKIVLKHCLSKGMTKEQQKEVEEIAKKHMSKIPPWKAPESYGDRLSKLNDNIKFIVLPNEFTTQQMQYLCACLKEYNLDTLVLAKENGKEAHIMTFNASTPYYFDEKRLLDPAFSEQYVQATATRMGSNFCRAYNSSHSYVEIHIEANDNVHIDLQKLKKVLDRANEINFSHISYAGMGELYIDDEPVKTESAKTDFLSESDNVLDDTAGENTTSGTNTVDMIAGDSVLNGDENNTSTSNDSIDDVDIDDR